MICGENCRVKISFFPGGVGGEKKGRGVYPKTGERSL